MSSSRPPTSLYLHFPFCARHCHYCDYSIKPTAAPPVADWLLAVERELAWWFEAAGWEPGALLDTILVGGGTPSLMGLDGMDELARRIGAWFDIDPRHTEFSAEANPESFDARLAERWRRAGVNRVSLGIQSLSDDVLRWLGRLHDRSRALAAIADAEAAGFDSVSVDIIFGLPGAVARDIAAEAQEVVDLGLSHASLYGLSVEPSTTLAQRIGVGDIPPPSEESYASEYRLLSARLRGAGYCHYEVSNFARPGRQCRHSWSYWNRSPYLALGPSAHSFLPPVRSWNFSEWNKYERAILAGPGPVAERERTSPAAERELTGPVAEWERTGPEEERIERIWLGLRTNRGLDEEFAKIPESSEQLPMWTESGWIEKVDGRWIATAEGWLRLDALAAEIAAASVR